MFLYPFVAVVGMERAKRSLVLHAVDPRIGGVLLLGHRGCAKSTLARGFASLLPPVAGQSAPFKELPLGVSEDRLLGSIHAEALVRSGDWRTQTGLLQAADGGVLYVDEINLLPDAMADLLLDSSASGVHRLERDGLSEAAASRYILVGTMNPEEGDLRPQLSDRFAHGVPIVDSFSVAERVEIGRRRMAFDDAPAAFLAEWEPVTADLNLKLVQARGRLLQVHTPDALRHALAERARTHGLEGLRAELAILRTARAAAAFRGDERVSAEDIEEAWVLCLGHRLPESAPPKSPSQSVPPPPSRQEAPARSPMAPKDAHPTSIPLRPMQKPRIIALPQPVSTTRHLTAPMRLTARLSTCRLQPGRVSWHGSVLASLQNGWRPGRPGWRWVHASKQSVRRLWVLLDGSRSAGAAQFLAQAREALAGLLPSFKRVHLLLICDGKTSWLQRNATAVNAARALEMLPDASGKTPLAEALQKLTRAVSGRLPTKHDTVCLCSDGLPTLRQGETAGQAGGRVRSILGRLNRNLASPALWLCPEGGREMVRWVGEMVKGTGVQLVRIPQK